jgi:hypothetical protein
MSHYIMSTDLIDDPLETEPFGNIDWLTRESGWTQDKVARLSRLGLIPGARQAQPGVQGSPWSYRKARTLRWLRSLET